MKLLFTFIFIFHINSFAQSEIDEHLFVVSGVVVNSGASQKIENFIKMIKGYSRKNGPYRGYSEIFGEGFLSHSNNYANSLVYLKWKGNWVFPIMMKRRLQKLFVASL